MGCCEMVQTCHTYSVLGFFQCILNIYSLKIIIDFEGMALVDAHGAESSGQMLTLFESYLEKQAVENEEIYDRIRQGAVVFMGTLARHMESDTPKVQLFLPSSQTLSKSWVMCEAYYMYGL